MTYKKSHSRGSEDGDAYWNKSEVSGFDFDLTEGKEALNAARSANDCLLRAIDAIDTHSTASGDSGDHIELVDWTGAPVAEDGAKRPPRQTPSTFHPSVADSGPSALRMSPKIIRSSLVSATDNLSLLINPPPSSKLSAPSLIGSNDSASSVKFDLDSPARGNRLHSSVSPGPSSSLSKLEDENRRLRARINHQQYRKPGAKETVCRIIRGDPHSLEFFKSKADKVELLDIALRMCDGNAIVAILLFLKDSLVFSLFQELLLTRPVAANHYVSFLRESERWDDLTSTLFSLGRKEEAAMIEFRQAAKRSDVATKIGLLKRSVMSSFSTDPSLVAETGLLTEYVSLLERQQPIEAADNKVVTEGKNQQFKRFPKSASLLDQSVLTTLYYCCLYHYELPVNSYASPASMRQHHKLSEKQFVWIAIKALSRQQKWTEINQLITSKGILGIGNTKLKSPIPYEKLVVLLRVQKAPVEILSVYVKEISDVSKRLNVAMKNDCHKVVVDCLVIQRNRQALISYLSKLTPHTKEAYYAEAAMQNAATKWLN